MAAVIVAQVRVVQEALDHFLQEAQVRVALEAPQVVVQEALVVRQVAQEVQVDADKYIFPHNLN